MPEPIVTLNEESLRSDLRELVRRTVEEMLNGLLDEEAGDLVGAERYERTESESTPISFTPLRRLQAAIVLGPVGPLELPLEPAVLLGDLEGVGRWVGARGVGPLDPVGYAARVDPELPARSRRRCRP